MHSNHQHVLPKRESKGQHPLHLRAPFPPHKAGRAAPAAALSFPFLSSALCRLLPPSPRADTGKPSCTAPALLCMGRGGRALRYSREPLCPAIPGLHTESFKNNRRALPARRRHVAHRPLSAAPRAPLPRAAAGPGWETPCGAGGGARGRSALPSRRHWCNILPRSEGRKK